MLVVCSVDLHRHMLTSADLPLHLHTSVHLSRTCTSTLSLLHIRPLFLSFFLSFFFSFFLHVLSLTCVDLHLDTLTSADLPLHLHTSVHLSRTCTSTLSLLHVRPLFPSFYIFSLYFEFNFFATSYSITDCIKKSWLLDNSIVIVS